MDQIPSRILFQDRPVIVTSPLFRNTYTGHAGFTIRETAGENMDRDLVVDLNAEQDGYRRQLFRILQTRNDAPVPYFVGTALSVRSPGYVQGPDSGGVSSNL